MVWGIRARDAKWKQHDWRGNFRIAFKEEYGNLVLTADELMFERPAVKLELVGPNLEASETRELTCF